MNELIVKEEVVIENLIYEVRGKQVLLDSDLARLYETETRIKKNFLKDFALELLKKSINL